MKKALMLGAMSLVLSAASMSAKAASYTFLDASGDPYCDGLSVSKGTVVTGLHLYEACGTGIDMYVGGVESKIPSLGGGKWYALTQSWASGAQVPATEELIYYTNFGSLEWDLYLESTYYGIPFELVNDGPLGKGYSKVKVPGKSKMASTHAALQKAGLIKK